MLTIKVVFMKVVKQIPKTKMTVFVQFVANLRLNILLMVASLAPHVGHFSGDLSTRAGMKSISASKIKCAKLIQKQE